MEKEASEVDSSGNGLYGSADIEQWFIRLLVDEIVNLILRLATPNRKC